MTLSEFAGETKKGSGNILVMDRLQDPGNIGTLIRTAEAAGYRGIIIIKGTGDVSSPKVVRAAAGSALRMPIIKMDTPNQVKEFCEENLKRLIGTSIKDAVPFYKVDLTQNIALVIGNEGNGMSDELEELSHENIMIPMEGGNESLNAAVAAGIIMYQSIRKD